MLTRVLFLSALLICFFCAKGLHGEEHEERHGTTVFIVQQDAIGVDELSRFLRDYPSRKNVVLLSAKGSKKYLSRKQGKHKYKGLHQITKKIVELGAELNENANKEQAISTANYHDVRMAVAKEYSSYIKYSQQSDWAIFGEEIVTIDYVLILSNPYLKDEKPVYEACEAGVGSERLFKKYEKALLKYGERPIFKGADIYIRNAQFADIPRAGVEALFHKLGVLRHQDPGSSFDLSFVSPFKDRQCESNFNLELTLLSDQSSDSCVIANGPDKLSVNCSIPQRPDPVQPDPVQPDPVQPDPVQPDPVQPDPVQPDPVQPDPVQPDPVQPDPVQPDPVQPDLVDEELKPASDLDVRSRRLQIKLTSLGGEIPRRRAAALVIEPVLTDRYMDWQIIHLSESEAGRLPVPEDIAKTGMLTPVRLQSGARFSRGNHRYFLALAPNPKFCDPHQPSIVQISVHGSKVPKPVANLFRYVVSTEDCKRNLFLPIVEFNE